VSEIFRKREDIQANPKDYQALIDSLAKAGVKAAASPERWKDQFDDPRDADANRAHVVEIAAEQFRDRGAADHAETVLAYLHGSVDRLIDSGRLEALRTAVRAAAELAASKETPDSVRESASAWTREAVVPSRLARILAAAVPDDAAIDPALDLARLAGDGAADAIFPALASAPRALSEGLLDILAGFPAERILAHARGCSAAGWSGLRPLFPVLRRLDAPAVQDFVVELLEHQEENVRSHALDALNDRALESGHVSDLLFALLQDPSPRIVKEAVRKLGALEGDAAVELLGDFVRGRLIRSAAPPPSERRLFAVRVLTLRGAPGWKRLEKCLAGLSWKIRGDDVQVAHAIASVMERRTSDPGAARELRRWRWSPARCLGGLFRNGSAKVQS
jgi:hypothetical protein